MNTNWVGKLSPRDRNNCCIIVTADGSMFLFDGRMNKSVDGVYRAVKTNYIKRGKWSEDHCNIAHHDTTNVVDQRQAFSNGDWFPGRTWNEAFEEFQYKASNVVFSKFQEFVRSNFVTEAARLDEAAATDAEFS